MIFATLANEIRDLSKMFRALLKFALKEDKLELEYHNYSFIRRETKDSIIKTSAEINCRTLLFKFFNLEAKAFIFFHCALCGCKLI